MQAAWRAPLRARNQPRRSLETFIDRDIDQRRHIGRADKS
jgi:hypothetical protein